MLDELARVRTECGWPPLNEPVGGMLGSQALLHVLSAQRWQAVVDEVRLLVAGVYGVPPRPVDPIVRRAVELLGDEGLPPRRRRGSSWCGRLPPAWRRARKNCS